jgi:tripartite-type tricarboxylate transporter receptor subunit TctC
VLLFGGNHWEGCLVKLPRRKFLHLAASAAALPAVSNVAWAQAYPTRPVRWIVGFAPGGAADINPRLMAQWLSERLGKQFIIENRPGANTNIAMQTAVNSRPDGYTLVSVTSSNSSNATLYESLPFNLQRDLTLVAALSRGALALEVNPSFQVKSVAEFIAYAKSNPAKITIASYGIGSTSHLAQELLKMMTGINVVHVPYRGEALALTDAISGQVHATFATVTGSLEYVRSGRLRALGVTTGTRWDALPEVPTIGDFVTGYEASTWSGVAAPKGIPLEIAERLNREINAGLADAKIRARIADLSSVPMPMTRTEFDKLFAHDTEKWAKVIRAANIKPE